MKYSVQLVQRGFHRSLPKVRRAWSKGEWDPRSTAQTALYYAEKKAGRAGVSYTRERRVATTVEFGYWENV